MSVTIDNVTAKQNPSAHHLHESFLQGLDLTMHSVVLKRDACRHKISICMHNEQLDRMETTYSF